MLYLLCLLWLLRKLQSLFPKDNGNAPLKRILDLTEEGRIDGDAGLISLILVQLTGDILLGLQRIAQNLCPDPMERLQECLRVQVLSRRKESVHISGNQVQKRLHAILVMQSDLFLIGLDLPQQLLLLGLVKFIDQLKRIALGLRDSLGDLPPLPFNGLNHRILS